MRRSYEIIGMVDGRRLVHWMDRKRDGEVCESLRNWAMFNQQGIAQAWDAVAEAMALSTAGAVAEAWDAEGQKFQSQAQQQGEETQLVPLAIVNS